MAMTVFIHCFEKTFLTFLLFHSCFHRICFVSCSGLVRVLFVSCSGLVRVLFGSCSCLVRVLFVSCSCLVRVLFVSCSGLVRVCFGISRREPKGFPNKTKRIPEEDPVGLTDLEETKRQLFIMDQRLLPEQVSPIRQNTQVSRG